MQSEGDCEMIRAGRLSCPECERRYVIEQGVARLLPEELHEALRPGGSGWETWRELMEQFLAWRERNWGVRGRAEKRRSVGRRLQEAFVEFCGLRSGSGDVLDIGCGTGHARDLLSRECRYVGVDPLPGGREPEGGSLPAYIPTPADEVRMVQGVGEALPFCAGSFDAAVVMGSLDHCKDPARVVAEAARVLWPGGTLGILQGLSRSGAVLRLARRIVRGGSRTHLHRFTMKGLRELLERHFEVGASKVLEGRAFVTAIKRDEGEGRA